MDEHDEGGGGRSSRPVRDGRQRRPARIYDLGKVLGNGSFGIVCEATCRETGETVAVKKVLQDPRYKNRELDTMKQLRHPNIVTLIDSFYTEEIRDVDGVSTSDLYLNVVMDHIPDTTHRIMKTYVRNNQSTPTILVKVYTYQMCRAVGYLHALGICHRDIKPQNLLVDTRRHILKLCDFGSAKRFVPSEASVAYICSRFYRAPELMLGATEYTTAIDIWSIGCVMAELILGRPLFAGETSVDQLVKIIQVLGTPTQKQMQAMNPNYTDFRFPEVRPKEWRKVLGLQASDDALKLIDALLQYDPNERLKPLEALAHPYFAELRHPDTRLPNGNRLPDLFSFTSKELQEMSPQTKQMVLPSWASTSSTGHGQVQISPGRLTDSDRSAAAVIPHPVPTASAVAK